MNILVTGGAGFIGSNFIKYMLDYYDYNIINLDSLTYAGNLSNLKSIENNEHYYFVEGDIRDQTLLNNLFKEFKITIIINFAAESHVDRSIEDPGLFLETNVLGTQSLLEAARVNWEISNENDSIKKYRSGVKYIQISTDEVYGTLSNQGYFTESTPLAPNSPYSASKASADMLTRAYHETYGLPVNITRCSNNYGPFQHPEKLIPLMIHKAIKEQFLPVYGDGKQIRDWLHVEDHCSAIDTVLHKGINGEIYNIGGNNEKENLEVIKIIINSLGKNEKLIKTVQDRLGHDRRYAIDNSKILKELNWKPNFTFDEGINQTINWYLKNKNWIENIWSREK